MRACLCQLFGGTHEGIQQLCVVAGQPDACSAACTWRLYQLPACMPNLTVELGVCQCCSSFSACNLLSAVQNDSLCSISTHFICYGSLIPTSCMTYRQHLETTAGMSLVPFASPQSPSKLRARTACLLSHSLSAYKAVQTLAPLTL